MRETAKAFQNDLIQNIRKDNDRALEALQKKAGIEVVKFEESDRDAWDALAVETHNALVGEIYSQEFLDKINALLQEYRAKN